MDTTSTTITKAGPEDLIATVWFTLGFKPRESLIIAGLVGPRHRIGVILRADLPDPHLSRSRLRAMLREVLLPVTESRARGVVAMIASEQALAVPPPAILSALRREIASCRLGLLDILGVTPTAYRSLLCRDPTCCPVPGQPLDRVLASRGALAHVLNGDPLAESQDDLLADVQAGPADPDAGSDVGSGPVRFSAKLRWSWWQRWNDAVAAAAGPPPGAEPAGVASLAAVAAGLSGALHDPQLRDAVMMSLLGASEQQVMWFLDGRISGRLDDDLDQWSVPKTGPQATASTPASEHQDRSSVRVDVKELLSRPPDPRRVQPGQAVLAAAVRVAAVGDQAPALAVLGMLAWFDGRCARARLLLERAERDCSSLSLTRLVTDLLVRQITPPWAVGVTPQA
jgi:hypothetical protein